MDVERSSVDVENDDMWLPDSEGEDMKDTRQLVLQQNRKKKKSGGFQSMGKIAASIRVYRIICRFMFKLMCRFKFFATKYAALIFYL